MDHLKNNRLQTKEEIQSWLRNYGITSFYIYDNLEVSVTQSVFLTKNIINKVLKYIPIQFKHIQGSFNISGNKLTSLEGCPKTVEEDFICNGNKLKSLEYGPQIVGGNYDCGENNLVSLNYSPDFVGGNFICANNSNLKSFKNMPKVISGKLGIYNTKINSLDDFDCNLDGNLIHNLYIETDKKLDGFYKDNELNVSGKILNKYLELKKLNDLLVVSNNRNNSKFNKI